MNYVPMNYSSLLVVLVRLREVKFFGGERKAVIKARTAAMLLVDRAEATIPSEIRYNTMIDGWGFEMVDGKRTVIYTIIIMASNGSTWCVRRRYSEFRDNWMSIKHGFPKSKVAKFKFPGKTVFRNSASGNERQKQLQMYLNELLTISPTPLEVMYFLRITRKVLGLDNRGADSQRLSGSKFQPEEDPRKTPENNRNTNPHISPDFFDDHDHGHDNTETGNTPMVDGGKSSKNARAFEDEKEEDDVHDSFEDENGGTGDEREISKQGWPDKPRQGSFRKTRTKSTMRRGSLSPYHHESELVENGTDDDGDESYAKSRKEPKAAGGRKTAVHMDFARDELDDLSDETSSSGSDDSDLEIDPSETMTEVELNAKRRMLEIKRAVRKRMRGLNTMHTTKVMRPYTMGHHIALLEEGSDGGEESEEHQQATMRTEAFIVFLFYGSLICVCKLVVDWIGHYNDHKHWYDSIEWGAAGKREGYYSLVAWVGKWIRTNLYGFISTHHIGVSFILKTTIFLVLFMSCAHKLIGWALSEWLFTVIGTPKGAFRMTFGALTLRISPLYNDDNEIMVSDYVWHNIRPKFSKTPFFGKINTLRLKFDFLSLIDAFRYRSPIKITEFLIDGLTIHIERGQRQSDGLNLWAVLGADGEEESLAVKEGIISKLAGAAMAGASGTAHLGKSFVSGMASGVLGAGSMGYRGVKMVGGAAMTYNPITLTWEAVSKRTSEMIDPDDVVPDDFEDTKEGDDEGGSAEESECEDKGGLAFDSAKVRTNRDDQTDGDRPDMSEVDKEGKKAKGWRSSRGRRRRSSSGRDSSRRRRRSSDLVSHFTGSIGGLLFDDVDSSDGSGIEYDTDDDETEEQKLRHGMMDVLTVGNAQYDRRRARTQRNARQLLGLEQEKKGEDPEVLPDLEFHWGVPYKFDCTRFTARNLNFYVKDYLAARHTEHAPIHVPLIEMNYDEMGAFHYSSGNGILGGKDKRIPTGLYLDDLMWRIINRLIADLLSSNAFSLLSTVGASGLNQTKNALVGAAHYGAKSSWQMMYNYNPKELVSSAMTGIRKVAHMGAPKLARSPSVQDMQCTKLKVVVGGVRGLTRNGIDFSGTCVCKVELRNQPGQNAKHYQHKSQTCTPSNERDEDGRLVYHFGEAFEIDNLTTLNAELYVRIFQSSVLKDKNIGEIFLPIRDDVSPVVDEVSGRVVKKNKMIPVWEEDKEQFTTYLPGIREDKHSWYLLYSKGTDDICGEVFLSLGLY